MNKKGQALVEFVLVLPVLIFMLLAFIDIGKLMIMKNHLESVLSTVGVDTTFVEDMEYDIKFSREEVGDIVNVKLESCIDTITPGLGKIIGDPACTSTSKVIRKDGNYEKN